MSNRAALPSLVWFSQRTAQSLAGASAAWLLSGLSQAPLINGLLPALSASTTLLPLRPRAWLGMALPLQRWLLTPRRLSLVWLQRLGDAGGLTGSLLTALLFPLLRNTAPQFAMAALLLLPDLLLVSSPRFRPPAESAPMSPVAASGLDLRSGAQGLLFGALFALLPLWVRTIGGGDCVDFGLVLAAYGLGRILTLPLPLPGWSLYAAMAMLLQATTWLPAWGSTALFVPLGALAAGSDGRLAASLTAGGGEGSVGAADGLARIDRSLAIGSLLGSLAMGAGSQLLGLSHARSLIVTAYGLAALVLPRRHIPTA